MKIIVMNYIIMNNYIDIRFLKNKMVIFVIICLIIYFKYKCVVLLY